MQARDITLTFSDGETMHFAALAGQSVLVSAEKAGNLLASECREGTCRTCAARDESGEEILLCQTPAEIGFRAKLPYRRADVAPPTLRRAKINAFGRVSASVWEIRYRLQFPLPFLPGQYVEATFPGMDLPRRFSMANPPDAKEQVFHVRDLRGGGMSDYLGTRAKPEDAFTVRGPFGVFYRRATPSPKLFVAGGTGLAPMLSMLSSLDAASCPPLALVAGFASADDAYAVGQINELAARLPLQVVLTADTPADGWLTGNAVAAIDAVSSLPFAHQTEAYLCGPPMMVRAARDALLARGLSAERIFNEEFTHAR
jgi:NAD(P)H-flavin reductase